MGQTLIRQNQIVNDGWVKLYNICTYSSADDPTYVFTAVGDLAAQFSVGMRVKVVQGTSIEYFILTACNDIGDDTHFTLYGGTDYDLADDDIDEVYFSRMKAPQGFPLSPEKWTESYSSTSATTLPNSTSFTTSAFSLSIPIGVFDVNYLISLAAVGAGGVTTYVKTALGKTTTPLTGSQDYKDSTDGASSVTKCYGIFKGSALVTNTTKTTVYILSAYANSNGNISLTAYQESFPTTILAVCAYL